MDPFTVVGSFAFIGPFNSMVPFASCGPLSSVYGVSLLHGEVPDWELKVVYAGSATVWQKAKQRTHRNDCNVCNRETLKSSSIMPTTALYTHYLPYAINIVRNGIMYKTILILILILFYYTVYFR